MKDGHVGHFELHIHSNSHREDVKGDIFMEADKNCYTAHVRDGLYINFSASTSRKAVLLALDDFINRKGKIQ